MVLETALQHTPTHLSGDTLFKLYDTYGFPLDLTADIARERRVTLDVEGFERIMQEQRTRARAASRFTSRMGVDYHGEPTRFVGYDSLEEAATVVALYFEGSPVQQLLEGQGGIVVLDTTPFYAESGGQVGDQGQMLGDGIVFSVEDTQKIQADVFGHHGHVLQGNLRVGDRMNASVRQDLRCQAALNHSVTHLLHAALRAELGDHVAQRGSLVDAQRTRFDFSHGEPLTLAQMQAVESRVNAQIRANVPVQVATMSYDQAIQQGATALFGEKYGAEVRVVGMGPFSTELCGGTHVSRTGDIGLFRLVTQSGVAAGIRRVEGITGADAMALMQHEQSQLLTLAGMFHVQASDLVSRLQQVQEDSLDRERQLAHLNAQLAANTGLNLLQHAKRVGEVQVLVTTLDKSSAKGLRDLWDALKFRGSLVVLLATVQDGKVALLAGVSSDLTPRIKAGELVGKVAQQIGGKGGGRPDLAQAGGSLPDALPGALAEAQDWIETRLLS